MNTPKIMSLLLKPTTFHRQGFAMPRPNETRPGSGYALFAVTTWHLLGLLPVWRRRVLVRDLLPHEWISAPTHNNQF